MKDHIFQMPDPIAFAPFEHTPTEPTDHIDNKNRCRETISDITGFFLDLEDFIDLGILRLACSVNCRMSFSERAKFLASLAHHRDRIHNLGLADVIDQLAAQWRKAKELRDHVVQSQTPALRQSGFPDTFVYVPVTTSDAYDHDFLEAVANFIEMAGLAVVDLVLTEGETPRSYWRPSADEWCALEQRRQQRALQSAREKQQRDAARITADASA